MLGLWILLGALTLLARAVTLGVSAWWRYCSRALGKSPKPMSAWPGQDGLWLVSLAGVGGAGWGSWGLGARREVGGCWWICGRSLHWEPVALGMRGTMLPIKRLPPNILLLSPLLPPALFLSYSLLKKYWDLNPGPPAAGQVIHPLSHAHTPIFALVCFIDRVKDGDLPTSVSLCSWDYSHAPLRPALAAVSDGARTPGSFLLRFPFGFCLLFQRDKW